MGRYLDSHFQPQMLDWVCGIRSEAYYVNMAIAWYLCEALIKQYPLALAQLETGQLSHFVHNKAIQKATESRMLSQEQKDLLRSLRMR